MPKAFRSNGYLNGTILKLTPSINGKYTVERCRIFAMVLRISASNPIGQ